MTRAMADAGRFITFEGVEGSGKSLQMGLAVAALRSRNIEVVATREPGGTRFGEELRRILLAEDGPPRDAAAELLLYLADRVQHLHEVVEPALARGSWVLSDRYHHATLAYQGHARGLGVAWIQRLAIPLGIRRPDLVVILDVPVELGLERARARNHQEQTPLGRFEAESLEFHQRVREGYLRLAGEDPSGIVVIDAVGAPLEVSSRVWGAIAGRFGL
jgi:dTMP kinase